MQEQPKDTPDFAEVVVPIYPDTTFEDPVIALTEEAKRSEGRAGWALVSGYLLGASGGAVALLTGAAGIKVGFDKHPELIVTASGSAAVACAGIALACKAFTLNNRANAAWRQIKGIQRSRSASADPLVAPSASTASTSPEVAGRGDEEADYDDTQDADD